VNLVGPHGREVFEERMTYMSLSFCTGSGPQHVRIAAM